jgi:hypothetical protein
VDSSPGPVPAPLLVPADPDLTWRGRVVAGLMVGLLVAAGLHTWLVDAKARASVSRYPPLPADAGDRRLLPLPPPSYGSSYAFLETLPDGSPVAYDPCRPIHYVIARSHLPPYGARMIREAVAKASAATGLEFVEDGMTDEALDFNRAPVQVARYGNRWAPVLIAFSDARQSPQLGADVMGRGGSRSVAPDGPASARYVTGAIGLDQDDFDQTLGYSNGWAMGRATIMHELGHLVGLAHVTDQMQLMANHNQGFVFYGPGDQHGLALEGSGLCHHDT